MSSVTAFEADKTMGFLHVPTEPLNWGIVLTHGAGANCQAPLLLEVANAFASAGWHVLRCDLPFRQQRRFGPPHPAHAGEDRNGLRAAVAAMRQLVSGRVVLGGHSYGGRQASMLAAEEGSIADALLLLSYPLHPPEKPDKLRTEHFERLHTPALFVHGTKDPFGTVEEMWAALTLIPGRAELVTVEGAGHDLKRGKFDISALVAEPLKRVIAT
jgi:hypothetical protein